MAQITILGGFPAPRRLLVGRLSDPRRSRIPAVTPGCAARTVHKRLLGHGKPHIGWLYSKAFLQREQSGGRLSLELIQGALGDYVDSRKLQDAWQEYVSGVDYEAIHSVYVLSRWLEQNVNRIIEKKQGVR